MMQLERYSPELAWGSSCAKIELNDLYLPILSMFTLEDNLVTANCAIHHVKGQLPYGASNQPYSLFSSRERVANLRLQSAVLHRLVSLCSLRKSLPPIMSMYISLLMSYLHMAGNCDEQCDHAIFFLRTRGVRPLEKVSLIYGDHAFVIIGRDPASDLLEPETWGETAVVCDPWANCCFPAKDLCVHLDLIFKRMALGAFDLTKQKLKVCYRYRMLNSDYISFFKQNLKYAKHKKSIDKLEDSLSREKLFNFLYVISYVVENYSPVLYVLITTLIVIKSLQSDLSELSYNLARSLFKMAVIIVIASVVNMDAFITMKESVELEEDLLREIKVGRNGIFLEHQDF